MTGEKTLKGESAKLSESMVCKQRFTISNVVKNTMFTITCLFQNCTFESFITNVSAQQVRFMELC